MPTPSLLPVPVRRVRAGFPLALAALGLLLTAGPAAAGPIVSSAPDCEEQPLSKPFLRWADLAHYTPQPGGGFEGKLDGWSLGGGVKVVPGNERYKVAGEDHERSLSIPSGAWATTGGICVGLEHPTIRFFTQRESWLPTATLTVEVLFETALGSVLSLPIGVVVGSEQWEPTLPFPVVANLLPLLPGDRTAVAFRFRANGGDWRIDDLFVDPWRAR